jgi:hypothetical protein
MVGIDSALLREQQGDEGAADRQRQRRENRHRLHEVGNSSTSTP